jgi:hypothetical protein
MEGGDQGGRKEKLLWLWVYSITTQKRQKVQVMEPGEGLGPNHTKGSASLWRTTAG